MGHSGTALWDPRAASGEEGPPSHHQAWTSRATLPQANQLKALAKPVCLGEGPSGNSNLPVFALQANRAKQKCCFGTLSQISTGLPCQQCWASPPHVTAHSSLLCDNLLPLPLKTAHPTQWPVLMTSLLGLAPRPSRQARPSCAHSAPSHPQCLTAAPCSHLLSCHRNSAPNWHSPLCIWPPSRGRAASQKAQTIS